MALEKLKQRLEAELEPINAALQTALTALPPACQPVAAHVIGAGGKRLRPFLTLLTARLFGSDAAEVTRLAISMELLHAATLLHDDILDNAASRRGKPAAHTIYDNKTTILAGDALLALGNAIVAEFAQPGLTACYSDATMQTAAGEILEMQSLGRPDLSYDEYAAIATGKTACLIEQACAMGAHFASARPEQIAAAAAYGRNLGLAFQLVDDALDFAPEAQTGKPSGGDLREGKMTPPLQLYRSSLAPDARQEFDRNFSEGSFTEAQIDQIAAKVRPFAEKSRSFADACLAKAQDALQNAPECAEKEILLQMAEYIRDRKK